MDLGAVASSTTESRTGCVNFEIARPTKNDSRLTTIR